MAQSSATRGSVILGVYSESGCVSANCTVTAYHNKKTFLADTDDKRLKKAGNSVCAQRKPKSECAGKSHGRGGKG